MLDSDLAELYEIDTKKFNQAMKRNLRRFPKDFMFQLNVEENEILKSQSTTGAKGRGGRRYLPYAFTEQGGSDALLNSKQRSRHRRQYFYHANFCKAKTRSCIG